MPVVKFGSCMLDMDARLLSRQGRPVHLSPKAFQLLKVLLDARPKALSKADLHSHIWPDTFVTDDSLAGLVAEVRTAIGDSARTAAFIRTVHAFGYAFAADVVETSSAAQALSERKCWISCEGRAIRLDDGENIIGRDAAARVVLDSIRVSRRHARVTVKGQSAVLEDLASRNGTACRGQRINEPTELADGDDITIGGFTLRFRLTSDSAPTEADD